MNSIRGTDATVGGNVIIADGVGKGEFTLDNVIVNGDLVVRGGGINSVKLVNKSSVIGKIILRKQVFWKKQAKNKKRVLKSLCFFKI